MAQSIRKYIITNFLYILVFFVLTQISWSQRNCDSYQISDEINLREFIARNQVDYYIAEYKQKHEKYFKVVKFNDWYDIESITERLILKSKSPQAIDSLVIKTMFFYDLSTAKINQIIKSEFSYYKDISYEIIDTIQFRYNDDNISFCSMKKNSDSSFMEKKEFYSIKYDSSQLVSQYNFTLDFFDGYIQSDSIILDSPIRIDQIILNKNRSYPSVEYNSSSLIKSKVNLLEKQEYIYNKFNQLVLVVKTSNFKTLNPGTDKEVGAKPNASYDIYKYDNTNYLLNEIIYSNKPTVKYTYYKYRN